MKYAAELAHVKEVTLVGTADLAFWNDRLRPEGLCACPLNGRAQSIICAADSKYMGIRFREVSFSVYVSRREGESSRDGAFLVQAFNSVRFFAFVERTVFHTPYDHAAIRVVSKPPLTIDVRRRDGELFRAAMSAGKNGGACTPLRAGADGWEGPIYLPGALPGHPDQGRVFFGKLRGHTEVYAFDPSTDVVTFPTAHVHPTLRLFVESGFTATEWHVRPDAAHAKSKTMRRHAAGLA